ncbi:MAG: hypothetical protein EKK33_22800 [Bradyrhizobiaceae bacterium]|nr:MAG: hypothetical protein EKK33_22800 [Bradyrhizobiaceae bacterium]
MFPRHCEELLRRSNPDCHCGGSLDCFATLAMTAERAVRVPHASTFTPPKLVTRPCFSITIWVASWRSSATSWLT